MGKDIKVNNIGNNTQGNLITLIEVISRIRAGIIEILEKKQYNKCFANNNKSIQRATVQEAACLNNNFFLEGPMLNLITVVVRVSIKSSMKC